MVVDASRRIGHRVAPKPRESSTRSRDYTLEMRGDSGWRSWCGGAPHADSDSMMLRLRRVALVRHQVRKYVRDPQQAVEEASTVRGYRLAQQRLEKQVPPPPPPPRSKWEQAWRTWRATPLKWQPLPIMVGACVLVAVQAHRTYSHSRQEKVVDRDHSYPVREDGPWTMYILGALPLNSISRTWGRLNSMPLPVWFRPYGFRLYAWLFGCNLDEIREKDLTKYASLAEFFVRELSPGARPIDPHALLVSPADGKVLHMGVVQGDRVEQVKGLTYSLRSLLGYDSEAHTQQDPELGSSRNMSVAAERRFAKLNGIDYSLTQLLGKDSHMHRASTYAMGWIRGAWRWCKHLVMWKAPAYKTLPIHQASAAEVAADTAEEALEPEQGDVGIPTSDTPTNIGHYATVAYQMGPEALPHFQSEWHVSPGNRLFFCVIYLAPGDYHRFHSPVPWVVELRRHFRGELYSVSPYVATRLPNLFVMNERVALLGRWRHGLFSMTPIGATNVGSIQIHFDRQLRTNLHGTKQFHGTYDEATYNAASRILGGQPLAAGDEMGAFLLGSTVVLVFEAPEHFRFVRAAGDKIKVGEALGHAS